MLNVFYRSSCRPGTAVAMLTGELCQIGCSLIEEATVLKFSAKVPVSEGPDLLTYLFTSELVLRV